MASCLSLFAFYIFTILNKILLNLFQVSISPVRVWKPRPLTFRWYRSSCSKVFLLRLSFCLSIIFISISSPFVFMFIYNLLLLISVFPFIYHLPWYFISIFVLVIIFIGISSLSVFPFVYHISLVFHLYLCVCSLILLLGISTPSVFLFVYHLR